MTVTEKGTPCPQCGHDFDSHVVYASASGNPMDGGLMSCPECDCTMTWSVGRGKA